jgi:hypothetical protein
MKPPLRMKPEVVYTKSAPKTGFSECTESPIAQGVNVEIDCIAYIPER